MEFIAQRTFVVIDRDTDVESLVTFEVMLPYPIDNGASYHCPVRIAGLLNESLNIGGVDSMQAVMLAIQWLEMRYQEMSETKYDFFWPDKRYKIESFNLLPK